MTVFMFERNFKVRMCGKFRKLLKISMQSKNCLNSINEKMRTFDYTDHDDNVDQNHQNGEETDSVEMFILDRFVFPLKNRIR